MSDVLRFDLAKDPKGNPITYGRVGDSNGLVRRVKVFEDGKPFDLTGWTTTFEGNTSKYKTKVFDSEGITIINAKKGEFSYTFPNMAFAVEGQYERAYFSLIKSNARKTTGNFEIIVFGNSDIDAPEAETIITEYNKLVDELRRLQDQAIGEMNQKFASTQAKIKELEKQLTDTQAEIDKALEEFRNGAFYSKNETDEKINATQAYKLTKNDGRGRSISELNPKPTAFKEIIQSGSWYLTGAEVTAMTDSSEFPPTADGNVYLGSGTLEVVPTAQSTRAIQRFTRLGTQFGTSNVTVSRQVDVSGYSSPWEIVLTDRYKATQPEAEAGTATNKFMTPALVFKAIAKWVQGKFVSATGNETILGTKNFQDGLQVGGVPVGVTNEACWCEDFTVNNLAAGIVNPDIQRFSTSNAEAFSMIGKTITVKKAGVYLITLGVNYTGLSGWLTFGVSRAGGTSLVKRSLLESANSGSNSLTYVRSFEGNDQLTIEFNSGTAGTTMQKINLAIVKLA